MKKLEAAQETVRLLSIDLAAAMASRALLRLKLKRAKSALIAERGDADAAASEGLAVIRGLEDRLREQMVTHQDALRLERSKHAEDDGALASVVQAVAAELDRLVLHGTSRPNAQLVEEIRRIRGLIPTETPTIAIQGR